MLFENRLKLASTLLVQRRACSGRASEEMVDVFVNLSTRGTERGGRFAVAMLVWGEFIEQLDPKEPLSERKGIRDRLEDFPLYVLELFHCPSVLVSKVSLGARFMNLRDRVESLCITCSCNERDRPTIAYGQ